MSIAHVNQANFTPFPEGSTEVCGARPLGEEEAEGAGGDGEREYNSYNRD